MHATLHDVTGHPDVTDWSSLAHFHLGPGTTVPAEIVVKQSNWSLYALDKSTRQAIFVDLPADLDLSKSPFAYSDQQRFARRVLKVPFEVLSDLSEKIPPPQKVIFIFSTGRCGSTLVANALSTAPSVWSLSEPDVYSLLIMQNYSDGDRLDYSPDEVIGLISACTRLLFRPLPDRDCKVLAVKFRSQTFFQADLYRAAWPDASFVFLYRDAMTWANSIYKMCRKYGFPSVLTGVRRRHIWNAFAAATDVARLRPFVDIDAPEVLMEDGLAPCWACNMEEYNRHLSAGVPFMALRYNDLNTDRAESLRHLFAHCGLSDEDAANALSSFDHDSQAGTMLSQKVPADGLTEDQMARVRRMLDLQPIYNDPDLRLVDIYTGTTR